MTSSAPSASTARARSVAGSRTSARTGTPAASRARAVAPPCRPVAPVTRTGAESVDMRVSWCGRALNGGARHLSSATIRRTPPLSKLGGDAMPTQRADARRNYARIARRGRAGGRRARRRRVPGADRPHRRSRIGHRAPALPQPARAAGGGLPRADRGPVRPRPELAGAADARAALLDWLGALTTYAATIAGLADRADPRRDGSPTEAHVNCARRSSPRRANRCYAGPRGPVRWRRA